MSKFIDTNDVEEGDVVQITVTFTDDAENITTGRVRRDDTVWSGGSELKVGAVCIYDLRTAQSVKDYTIELLSRDEKHGYYLAAPKDVLNRKVFLWKYDSEWKIVKSPLSGDLVAEYIEGVEPSSKRRFIGTELPG